MKLWKWFRHQFMRVNRKIIPFIGRTKSLYIHFTKKISPVDYPIDFVVTWVDGNDKKWQQERSKYAVGIDHVANSSSRYRNWDTLKYWFRAVERYAPWVNNVFFVTCSQIPDWLNTQNEKLKIVNHKDFIPAQYLPTFSCSPIEHNLWRIKDLSEHFVYFNDDTFINRPVSPSDFFENGLPKLCSIAKPIYTNQKGGAIWWEQQLLNDFSIINGAFDVSRSIKNNPEKWFSYVLKDNVKYNKRAFQDGYIAGMIHTHSAQTYLKSVFPEIWDSEFQIMDHTSMHKFRDSKDATSFLPSLWIIFRGKFVPVDEDYYGFVVNITKMNLKRIEESLQSDKYRIVCINDGDNTNLESEDTLNFLHDRILSAFDNKFPLKSTYEL